MKELIKEETLDIVRQMITDGQVSQEVAEKYFPELKESKESEDERVKKAIKYGLDYVFTNNTTVYETTKEQCLAWLEKQGEENTIIVIPKFRVGDIIRPKGSTAEYTIESISGECYYGKGWGLHISCDNDYELVEQKPTWSEEDSIMYHRLLSFAEREFGCEYDLVKWFKSLKGRVGCEANCTTTWNPSEEQMVALDGICSYIRNKADWEISQDMISDLYKLSEQLKKLREE